MLRNISILIACCFVIFVDLAYSQGPHYTYPFSVVCSEGVVVAPGSVSFTAKFENENGGLKYTPEYSWSVSHGEIVKGQGTTAITVELGRDGGYTLGATLERNFRTPHFPGVQRTADCVVQVVSAPSARMTDEFRTGGDNCEEGLARIDAFLIELHNNPNSNGVVAIYGDTKARAASRIRALQLRRYAQTRGFDLSRLNFVLGAPLESGTTQFWIVPPGAEPPLVVPEPRLPPEPRPKLPYIHSARYLDGVPECNSYQYDLQDYAEVLNIEPKARARVVISETSKASFNRELRKITAALQENGVSARRIVAIYKNVRRNRLLESIELWVTRGP